MANLIGRQLGNYRLTHLLGQGGFASVYLGEHIHLNTRVAIKVLDAQLTNDDIELFRHEARMIAHLSHPHIVRVLDFGIEYTIPYLVMDYALGGTLRQKYPKGTQLPLETITHYVQQVADALQYAHNQKVIHRDVKPENMLLGPHQEILLSDFGIALMSQSSRSHITSDMAGTIAYMAPEQIDAHPCPASDQYSLGIIVYEWLCGDLPFQGSFIQIAINHHLTPPPSLLEKRTTLPPTIEQVIMTALAKDPQQRFDSIQTFATALKQAAQATHTIQTLPLTKNALPSQSLHLREADKQLSSREGAPEFHSLQIPSLPSVEQTESSIPTELIISSRALAKPPELDAPFPSSFPLNRHAGQPVYPSFPGHIVQSVMTPNLSPPPPQLLPRRYIRPLVALLVLIAITGSLSFLVIIGIGMFQMAYGYGFIFEALLSLILSAVIISRGILQSTILIAAFIASFILFLIAETMSTMGVGILSLITLLITVLLPPIFLVVNLIRSRVDHLQQWNMIITGMAALTAAFASLNLGSLDLQSLFHNMNIPFNELLTFGLIVAAITPLLLIIRRFNLVNRIILLTLFGFAILCTILQYSMSNSLALKHILLLTALNTLIAGVLLMRKAELVPGK